MSNSANQLVVLYEVNGLTVEQLAQLEHLEVTAVKALLYSHSAKYRADIETHKSLDFDETDAELALRVIRRVAEFSEDDHTALKAATFIRNDKKGRLDVKSGIRKLNINVNVLNEHFAKAAEAIAAKVLPASKQITDV